MRPADLVKRHFIAEYPNQLRVADITYVKTITGWVYTVFITDVFSKMIEAYSVFPNITSLCK